VTGIGGLFFLSQDPAALGRWYQEHLGVSLTPSSCEESPLEAGGRADRVQPVPRGERATTFRPMRKKNRPLGGRLHTFTRRNAASECFDSLIHIHVPNVGVHDPIRARAGRAIRH
jgi:hypothetical protein